MKLKMKETMLLFVFLIAGLMAPYTVAHAERLHEHDSYFQWGTKENGEPRGWWKRNSMGQRQGPGGNIFDPNLVWVEDVDTWYDGFGWVKAGDLVMNYYYNPDAEEWRGCEVYTEDTMGLGTYQWQVVGRLDTLDKHMVLGLFSYPITSGPNKIGVDETHEVDIEFSRWNQNTNLNGSYGIWPTTAAPNYPIIGPPTSVRYPFTLSGTWTTHKFIRMIDKVYFQSQGGHRAFYDNTNWYNAWTYWSGNDVTTSTSGDVNHSTAAMPIHMNLWNCKGDTTLAPSDNLQVRIVIRKFEYREPAN